jgi:hypothetical protein
MADWRRCGWKRIYHGWLVAESPDAPALRIHKTGRSPDAEEEDESPPAHREYGVQGRAVSPDAETVGEIGAKVKLQQRPNHCV